MPTPEQPKNFVADAQKLRDLASDPTVELDVSSPGVSKAVDFDPAKGDRGLSFLAKRLYQEAGYDSKKALSAALMLSSEFVDRMGPDPQLKPGDRLIIDNGRAQLMTDLKGSNPRIVDIFLSTESRERAELRAKAPQLGLKPMDDPEQEGVKRLRTVEYQTGKDTGFRAFIMRLYQEAGYSIQDASVASNGLYGGFMQKTEYPPRLKDGDRLSLGPDYALFTPKTGPQVRVDFESEGLAEQVLLDRGKIETDSHQDRVQLVGTVSESGTGQDLLGTYNAMLSTRLVSIPNAIVFGHGTFMGDLQFCKVALNSKFYSVLENSKMKTYKLVQLDSGRDDRVVTGPVVQNWTSNFEDILKGMA